VVDVPEIPPVVPVFPELAAVVPGAAFGVALLEHADATNAVIAMPTSTAPRADRPDRADPNDRTLRTAIVDEPRM